MARDGSCYGHFRDIVVIREPLVVIEKFLIRPHLVSMSLELPRAPFEERVERDRSARHCEMQKLMFFDGWHVKYLRL